MRIYIYFKQSEPDKILACLNTYCYELDKLNISYYFIHSSEKDKIEYPCLLLPINLYLEVEKFSQWKQQDCCHQGAMYLTEAKPQFKEDEAFKTFLVPVENFLQMRLKHQNKSFRPEKINQRVSLVSYLEEKNLDIVALPYNLILIIEEESWKEEFELRRKQFGFDALILLPKAAADNKISMLERAIGVSDSPLVAWLDSKLIGEIRNRIIEEAEEKINILYVDYLPRKTNPESYFKSEHVGMNNGFFLGSKQNMEELVMLWKFYDIKFAFEHKLEDLLPFIYQDNSYLFRLYFGNTEDLFENFFNIKHNQKLVLRLFLAKVREDRNWLLAYEVLNQLWKCAWDYKSEEFRHLVDESFLTYYHLEKQTETYELIERVGKEWTWLLDEHFLRNFDSILNWDNRTKKICKKEEAEMWLKKGYQVFCYEAEKITYDSLVINDLVVRPKETFIDLDYE